jgi:preprotein translocase subunit SecD
VMSFFQKEGFPTPVLSDITGQFKTVCCSKEVLLTERDLKGASVVESRIWGPEFRGVQLRFSPEGRRKIKSLSEMTPRTGPIQVAIIVGGRVVSAPNFFEPVDTDVLVISGQIRQHEAEALMVKINSSMGSEPGASGNVRSSRP